MRIIALLGTALLSACYCGGRDKAAPAAETVPVAATGPDAQPAPAVEPSSQPTPELVAIDIFGTRQITREKLLASHEKRLREFAATNGSPFELEQEIRELGDFADVTLSLVTYYKPDGLKSYLTVDFVDRADAARRMPFLPDPGGTYEDPDDLIADWRAYQTKRYELLQTEHTKFAGAACAAFHCLDENDHPELEPLTADFIERVPHHVEALTTILRDDSDPRYRAAAALLLAYSKDGPALIETMVPAFRDSSMQVRNNALRVIYYIAFHHPQLEVPLEPVLAALDYPTTLDRNKVASILKGLLQRPGAARLHDAIAQARRAGSSGHASARAAQ